MNIEANTAERGSKEPDQSEAARLHEAGIKLVPLHHLRKRPLGDAWNKPEHFVRKVDLAASGYGIPLKTNGLCSIDPDQVDLAAIAMRAVGFNLDEIMEQGVRTTSTRPGSGGRSAFKSAENLGWFSFSVRLNDQKESTTIFELRAGSPNLQDCCPGVAYQTVRMLNGKEVVTNGGEIFRQEYANGKTFLEAPELPVEFAEFWQKMSTEPTFRREAENKMVAALNAAGQPAAPVFNLRFAGNKLAIEIDKVLRAKFNAAVPVESILSHHDYLAPRRKGGRWMSPGASGSPSVRLIPKHDSLWQSDHQSDPLNGSFDAAQASVVLDHNYEVEAFEQWVRERLQGLKREEAKLAFGGNGAGGDYADIPADPAGVGDSGRMSGGEPVFMPLEVPTDSSDPIGEFFRSAPAPFPMATLPPLIREWAVDQSRASGFDPGAYAYILLATFASWIDQRSRLQVSAGGYEVPPFFWAGLVDNSGGGKTPVFKASNKFIARLNTSLVRASMNDEFDEERAEQRVEDHRRRCEEAREQNLELPPPPPNYRFRQRIIADATVEAIAEMASGNPEGLIYQTDDISTFIGSLDAYGGKGKDRAFYLGLNDTKREHPVNRKGKPPLIIEHLSGALIAGMQPGIVAGQTKGGNSEDGLFQRFTLYQMAAAGRVNLDFVTKADLDARILEIFRFAFAAGVINARLNTPARKLAEDYINVGRNERHIGRMAQSHAQKLIGYTFRIAFALHAMECLCEGRAIEAEIGVTTIASAAEIVECLRKHAITAFDQFDGGEIVDLAQYALEQILSRGLTEFTQGDLSKHNKGWVSNDKLNFNATNALALLCDRGVIANGGAGTTPVGGRPATRWIVNPELHAKLKNAAHTLAEAKRDQYQQLKVKFSALRDLRDGNVEF